MSVIIPPTQVRLGCPYKKSAWPFRRAPFSDFQCRVVDGFTLIELLTTVAIVVALAAMLFPVLKKGIESSSRAKCVSNLRQLGIAVQLCVSDNDMTYPYQPAGNAAPANMQTAFEWIAPYLKWPEPLKAGINAARNTVMHCPNHTENPGSFSYRANNAIFVPPGTTQVKQLQIKSLARTVLFYEVHVDCRWPLAAPYNWGTGKSPYIPSFTYHAHGNVSNYLFCDGHVSSTGETIPWANWQPAL